VLGLAWSNDLESYAGGIVVTGRTSQSKNVKGDYPEKVGYTGPTGLGLCVGLTIPSHKKCFVEKLLKTRKRLRSTKDLAARRRRTIYS
jgi:hypothetical protein